VTTSVEIVEQPTDEVVARWRASYRNSLGDTADHRRVGDDHG
jgi:hypothetical protein